MARFLWVYEVQQQDPQTDKLDRWCDPGMLIAAGHVFLTPPGTDQLVCLRLADGHQAWSRLRRDGLYVAGMHEGKVLIVGRKGLRALKLEDGSSAWPGDVGWPGGAVASGRGYLGPSQYYVPLGNGEVAAVDLSKGEIALRMRSTDGTMPGNLVSCQGAVVSQGRGLAVPLRLRCPRASASWKPNWPGGRRTPGSWPTTAKPSWPKAATRKRSSGFARRLKAERNDRTQQLLADAVAEALRLDFPKFRPLVEELEKLLDKPEFRSRVLQEVALDTSGSARAAKCWTTT